MQQAQSPVRQSLPGLDGLRIAIQREHPARLAQPRQNRPAVPAAAERGIDVGAAGLYRQRRHRLLQQHRHVLQVRAHRRSFSSSGGNFDRSI